MKYTESTQKALYVSHKTLEKLDETLDILSSKLDQTNKLLAIISEKLSYNSNLSVNERSFVPNKNKDLSEDYTTKFKEQKKKIVGGNRRSSNTSIDSSIDMEPMYIPNPNIEGMQISKKPKASSRKTENVDFDDAISKLEEIKK